MLIVVVLSAFSLFLTRFANLPNSNPPPSNTGRTVGSIASIGIAILLVGLPFRLIPHYAYFARKTLLRLWTALVLSTCTLIIYHVASISGRAWSLDETRAAVIALIILVGIVSIKGIDLLFDLVNEVQWRRARAVYPDTLIINRLLMIMSAAESHRNRWLNPGLQQFLLVRLEQVARIMESNLPGSLKSGDAVTDTWYTYRSRQAAAAVRGLKKWLLTPKSDSIEHFARRIAHDLVLIASGDWDSLELIEAEKTHVLSNWRSRFSSILRLVLIAGMPWLLLLFLQLTPLALGDPIIDYVKIGLFVWTILSLIAALDPLFNAKITALKDVVSMLPVPSKGNKP